MTPARSTREKQATPLTATSSAHQPSLRVHPWCTTMRLRSLSLLSKARSSISIQRLLSRTIDGAIPLRSLRKMFCPNLLAQTQPRIAKALILQSNCWMKSLTKVVLERLTKESPEDMRLKLHPWVTMPATLQIRRTVSANRRPLNPRLYPENQNSKKMECSAWAIKSQASKNNRRKAQKGKSAKHSWTNRAKERQMEQRKVARSLRFPELRRLNTWNRPKT